MTLSITRVFLVEDHLLLRDAIRDVVLRCEDYVVVGESAYGERAISEIVDTQPDIVLVDLHLPDISGFDVIVGVMEKTLTIKFLAMSGQCDDWVVLQADRLGIQGHIDKQSALLTTLWHALTELRQGRTFFSESYQFIRKNQRSSTQFFSKILSDHECRILALIGESCSDEEIAAKLDITYRTAQTHRSNILRKLQIDGTPKLIAFAIEHGFVAKIGKTA